LSKIFKEIETPKVKLVKFFMVRFLLTPSNKSWREEIKAVSDAISKGKDFIHKNDRRIEFQPFKMI